MSESSAGQGRTAGTEKYKEAAAWGCGLPDDDVSSGTAGRPWRIRDKPPPFVSIIHVINTINLRPELRHAANGEQKCS